jgi:L-iditol 2-dehydrogenase
VLLFAVHLPGETVPVDFIPYWRNDVTIRTSYGAAPLDNQQALELIRSGRIDVAPLLTHRLPLDRIGEGFLAAAAGRNCLKVVIAPHAPEGAPA